eukprot:10312337-Ditylum_brightwellii.AAC.1
MVRYTQDKIKAKFLHPTSQRVEGEPDYAAINTITQQLFLDSQEVAFKDIEILNYVRYFLERTTLVEVMTSNGNRI